jgi:hypothetical protein
VRFIIAGSLVFTCKIRRCSFFSTAGRFNIRGTVCFFSGTCADDGAMTSRAKTPTAALTAFLNFIIVPLP